MSTTDRPDQDLPDDLPDDPHDPARPEPPAVPARPAPARPPAPAPQSLPVPAPGPITPGRLRASDADRDLVAQLLGAAYAEGRLTRDEHDARLDQAMSARHFDELVPLTGDLVPGGLPADVPAPSAPGRAGSPARAPGGSDADTLVAIFGGAERSGRWTVRRYTSAMAVFGAVDLDLREATFTDPVVEVNIFCLFGGVELKVPDGVRVLNQVTGIFGASEATHLAPPDPNAPTVVLKGICLFGGVDAHGDKKRWKRRAG